MTLNTLHIPREIFGLAFGVFVLFVFAIALAVPYRPKTLPGSSGHREPEDESGGEVIRADGYIDSFGGVIEEAGGGLPTVVKWAIPGVLIWFLLYLILYWTPEPLFTFLR
jgi:hypothetical protein